MTWFCIAVKKLLLLLLLLLLLRKGPHTTKEREGESNLTYDYSACSKPKRFTQ